MSEYIDADIGRLNFEGFIPKTPRYPDGRDRPSVRMNPVVPDVLVRHNASAFLKHTDHLQQDFFNPDPNLPNRGLVMALRAYASNFYARAIPGGGEIDYCSMDTSALLAIGKLLEATVETIIGETGDLAFVEGASFDKRGGPRRFYPGVGSWEPRVLEKENYDYWELLNSQRELTETGRAAKKARLAQSGSRGASRGRGSQKSCAPCYRQKKKCDHGHPCARCIAHNRIGQCVYESGSGNSRSRSRGRLNCEPCYRQKRACDRGRPCARCIKHGRQDQCIYDWDSQNEELSSKISLPRSTENSKSLSGNSSRSSSAQPPVSGNLERRHSGIDADEEHSKDKDGKAKVKTIEIAVRERPMTRSPSRDRSVSRGRRSKMSWSVGTPRPRPEEEAEMELDDFSSDGDLDSISQRRNPQDEDATSNAESDTSQPGLDSSGRQLGFGYDGSLEEFESDGIDSDADESDDNDAPIFDDLDSSSEANSEEQESQLPIHSLGKGKEVSADDSENESELEDEDYSSLSDEDKGTKYEEGRGIPYPSDQSHHYMSDDRESVSVTEGERK